VLNGAFPDLEFWRQVWTDDYGWVEEGNAALLDRDGKDES